MQWHEPLRLVAVMPSPNGGTSFIAGCSRLRSPLREHSRGGTHQERVAARQGVLGGALAGSRARGHPDHRRHHLAGRVRRGRGARASPCSAGATTTPWAGRPGWSSRSPGCWPRGCRPSARRRSCPAPGSAWTAPIRRSGPRSPGPGPGPAACSSGRCSPRWSPSSSTPCATGSASSAASSPRSATWRSTCCRSSPCPSSSSRTSGPSTGSSGRRSCCGAPGASS